MCTLTHLKTPEGYLIYFNRDEQKTRPKSHPPKTQRLGALTITMPIDPQSGGTWLAANSAGITLTLLNAYTNPKAPSASHPTPRKSRGHIIPKLITHTELDPLFKEIQNTDFSPYEEFSLVIFTLKNQPHLIDYRNGKLIKTENPKFPISSSGYQKEVVIPYRKTLYDTLVGPDPTEETLLSYHQYQDPQIPAFSPNMERIDAKTESLIKLNQTPQGPTLQFHSL